MCLVLACSPEARDRAKRFFFEIPDESAAAPAPAVESVADANSDGVSTTGQAAVAPPSTETQFASIHEPFRSRDCGVCHQSGERMSIGKEFAKTCGECHDKYFDEDQVNHEPVAQGDCLMCHVGHRSKEKWLLNRPVLTICSDCHEPDDLSVDAHDVPNGKDCAACHDAHFGKEHLLKPDRIKAGGDK
jgi:predicted CXXCH cytochrome family protein